MSIQASVLVASPATLLQCIKNWPEFERASGGAREVFARLPEVHRRPALDRQAEVDARRREVDELARMVEGEVLVAALAELGELPRIGAVDPAGGRDRDALEYALHAVLVLQPHRAPLELQRADGAEERVVAAQRPKELRRALLAQLRETLLQRLRLERILEH